MADLHPEALKLIELDQLAHLVTLNDDGSPQLTAVWVGIEGGEIVSGHMMNRRKLDNVRRDPRVVLSIESPTLNEMGLREYVTVHGSGRVTEGGAADLLQRLAHVYMGPDVIFPPEAVRDQPGFILRITPERLGGVGPWA
ncbi:MAG: PPOX class F420-dependent oxidoreductase [Solirubrobacterales bacterium]